MLTLTQENYIDNYVTEILNNLPAAALCELLSGYENDLNKLLIEMKRQTLFVTSLDRTLDSEKLEYLTNVEKSMDLTLRKQSYNYFKTTCLPVFRQGWRNLEWGNLVQLYPYSSILASRGSGKCFSPDTEIVMYDGSIRKIKDIRIGDQVMGIDSTPRTVLSIHEGESEMYSVQQSYSMEYECNEGHLIYCRRKIPGRYENGVGRDMFWQTYNVPVEDISKMPGYTQKKIMGVRVHGWDLPEQNLPLEPYFFGLWLGDGLHNEPIVTNIDTEVIEYLREFGEKYGYYVSRVGKYSYRLNQKKRCFKNGIKTTLCELGVTGEKHIPDIYMKGSRNQRLELLAGLLDADGHSQYHCKKHKKCFELSLVNRRMIGQVQQLVWSLGLRSKSIMTRKADVRIKCSKGEHVIKNYVYYRIIISGDVHEIPVKIKRKQIPYTEQIQDRHVSSLRVRKKGCGKYYGFSCDGDHLFLLKDGTIVHNSFEMCFAFILWRLYSYDRPSALSIDSIDNKNRQETCMITNNETLGKKHIAKIIGEIEQNDILKEKINPNGRANLAATSITTETGSILHLRSKDSMIRGLHVGATVCDDLPDESSLYSQEQREKLHEVFYGSITPIVEPYGYLCVCGTPYSPEDLYGDLKKDRRFSVFEYPAIFPDGRILAPDRLTFDKLTMERESLGTMVFNREYLVVPIADTATIFPYEYLKRSIHGMENISFANSIDDFPIKLNRVVVGCDFAISGVIGADYTVYSVWGIDSNKLIYLLNLFRVKGASHDYQVNKIVELNSRFRPNKIICESNGFQRILANMAKERGLVNVEEFITNEGNKKDLHLGLPSLSALFESGRLRVPYGNEQTRNIVDIMFGEFNSIAFDTKRGKLESSSGHDDICMSSFIAIQDLREKSVTPSIDYIELN